MIYENMFEISECKTKAGISVKPKSNLKVDFKKIKEKFEVIFDSPVAMVIKVDGCEIIVHKYGELLFKDCKDKIKIEVIAKKVYS